MWDQLPEHLSRHILDIILQNCTKQKSIDHLSRNVIDIIKTVYDSKENGGENAELRFVISTKKDQRYEEDIWCLLRHGCLYISNKQKKPLQNALALVVVTRKDYELGKFTDDVKEKACTLLCHELRCFMDSISENKYKKPLCQMTMITRTNVKDFEMPKCPDLYDVCEPRR